MTYATSIDLAYERLVNIHTDAQADRSLRWPHIWRTSIARTSLGPWKRVPDMGSSSY